MTLQSASDNVSYETHSDDVRRLFRRISSSRISVPSLPDLSPIFTTKKEKIEYHPEKLVAPSPPLVRSRASEKNILSVSGTGVPFPSGFAWLRGSISCWPGLSLLSRLLPTIPKRKKRKPHRSNRTLAISSDPGPIVRSFCLSCMLPDCRGSVGPSFA
ncbi:uncharacterized protein LY79DRAFT_327166 [Colletotrichum navitas]|uniref:Uncharacterized protein n=1 Tax=Colletotrichum navitas TaxID=681940 RepID=A0AAD8Q8W3_9PEZI|nr:uncharacterized protein LY79DRAFT_327166 [Colletotrichum navitas]KAK1598057.1 hypothetical protein LY79DRAFT_327166 [Colletotrichum navitas]